MLGYFDDLSAAIRRGEVTDSALANIARRHSMEVVRAGARKLRLRPDPQQPPPDVLIDVGCLVPGRSPFAPIVVWTGKLVSIAPRRGSTTLSGVARWI